MTAYMPQLASHHSLYTLKETQEAINTLRDKRWQSPSSNKGCLPYLRAIYRIKVKINLDIEILVQ